MSLKVRTVGLKLPAVFSAHQPRIICALILGFGVFFSGGIGSDISCAARETLINPDKLAIIELIEDRLADAYTIRTKDDTPCFGTLDLIFPNWHKGKPAEARRRWTFHGYRTYRVSHMVYSVFMNQPDQATVKGETRIRISRWFSYFIFPPELIHETFKQSFNIICRRESDSEWEILKEVRKPVK